MHLPPSHIMRNHGKPRADPGPPQFHPGHRATKWPIFSFVIMVHGTRQHAEALREEAAAVLAPLGLRLAEEKTRTVHIDEGFDFLGFTIRECGNGERASSTSTPCPRRRPSRPSRTRSR